MARLSKAEISHARAVEAELATVHEDSRPMAETFPRMLREYLGAARGFTYGPRILGHGAEVDFLHASGIDAADADLGRDMSAWLRVSNGPWALYDPVTPEPFQRNRVMPVGTYRQLSARGRGGAINIDRLRLGRDRREQVLANLGKGADFFETHQLADDHQLRMLACDGPVLMAWVGVFHSEPITPRQVALFRRIAPALKNRLVLEGRMRSAPIYRAGLEAALEAIARAVYVVTDQGALLHANAAGRAAFDERRGETSAAIAAALAGGPDHEVTPLGRSGAETVYLVLAPPAAPEARIKNVAARFALTPRQTDVLRALVRGHTNRRIAHALGCSERTVEVHVRALRDKVGTGSRAALIARALS